MGRTLGYADAVELLVDRYRAALDRPIVDPGRGPKGPLVRDAYVDPDFRTGLSASVRSDLYEHVVGHLTSPGAVTRPLVVLGGPGSGKSLLTEVLAARLPLSGFPAVRIDLGSVATEADLLGQTELGAVLREDALPVVLLDDATEPGFLETVEAFQRRCAGDGRPVAVVVTSRDGVLRVPADVDVVRLMPFSADNITTWLDVWNAAGRGEPLPVEAVLPHLDLAEQPLLLPLLALHHADGLARVDLYDRVLDGVPGLERMSAAAVARFHQGGRFSSAIFGEYLVARSVWRALRETRGSRSDDSLYALLSRTPLSSSAEVLEFLAERADGADDRSELAESLRRVLARQPARRSVPARHAVYSLNLVLLHVVLSPLCSSRDIGVDDWPRLTAFWKSQLSEVEWDALVGTLHVRWSGPAAVVLGIGADVPATVEDGGPVGRISLRDAVREARFTGDPVANEFRHAFEALPDNRCDVHYARALVQLAASPVDPEDRAAHYLRWAGRYPDLVLDRLRRDVTVSVATLRELAGTGLAASSAFVVQLCDRIGRGGPDEDLLDVVDGLGLPRVDDGCEIAMLDAWLRLHEQGYRHPSHRRVDLPAVLRSVDFEMVARLRPDLVYRCGTVAHEIGLFG
ncbi:hypothetical protein [Lentzea sp. NPDC055074]